MKYLCKLIAAFIILNTKTLEANGEPLMKSRMLGIPGPRSFNDRIAIIGAGPSGIHMAYRLKELGFRNVEILERENRIGGRVFDVRHRGTVQQMTFIVMFLEYTELMRVARKYSKGNMIHPKLNLESYFDMTRMIYPRYTKDKTHLQLKMELGRELVRYMKLHKRLFGDYDGFLMARPNARVRRAIRGTISDFLRRNKMPLIETAVIYGLYTGGGYGQPHKVSSIYGLMWITPKVCRYLLDDTVPVFTFFDTGLISLFETLIRRFAIDVKLNVDIRRIRRDDSKSFGNIQIEFSNRNNPMSTMVKEYDFLIISPAMRYLLDIIDVSPIEKKIFRRQLTDTFFMSTLVDSPFGVRSAYPFDVHRKRLIRYDFEPYVGIDVFSVSKNYSGESYKLGLTPGGKDGRRIQSTVYYQVGRDDPRIQEVGRYAEEKLHKHLREKHRIPYSLIARFITPYFTRFSVPDMDKGIIWDVFNLQGHRKTWYIGGSVTFDTAGAVIEYNEKILRNYRLPPKRFEFDNTL